MTNTHREKVRSFRGLVTLVLLWTLIPGALAITVVRFFDRLSKQDLVAILMLVLVALVASVGVGAVAVVRSMRSEIGERRP